MWSDKLIWQRQNILLLGFKALCVRLLFINTENIVFVADSYVSVEGKTSAI